MTKNSPHERLRQELRAEMRAVALDVVRKERPPLAEIERLLAEICDSLAKIANPLFTNCVVQLRRLEGDQQFPREQ